MSNFVAIWDIVDAIEGSEAPSICQNNDNNYK